MYLKKNYSWTIDLTTFELNVVRKCLRGEELNDAEDGVAEKLSSTMDSVYEDKCGGNTNANATNKKQWTNKDAE